MVATNHRTLQDSQQQHLLATACVMLSEDLDTGSLAVTHNSLLGFVAQRLACFDKRLVPSPTKTFSSLNPGFWNNDTSHFLPPFLVVFLPAVQRVLSVVPVFQSRLPVSPVGAELAEQKCSHYGRVKECDRSGGRACVCKRRCAHVAMLSSSTGPGDEPLGGTCFTPPLHADTRGPAELPSCSRWR